MRELVHTSVGVVEAVRTDDRPMSVLYFHGGHESASTAVAARLYDESGFCLLKLSRPGYGSTDVGSLSPWDFAQVVDEVRRHFGHQSYRAVVGTSFGGPQAIAYAAIFPERVQALILHSAAPSTHPYPDRISQRFLGPIVFHPAIESATWSLIRWGLCHRTDLALRMMLPSLSRLPTATLLQSMTESELREITAALRSLRSGNGFSMDVRFADAKWSSLRREMQTRVSCPTLLTASRQDAGVSWKHAEDFQATIRNSQLCDTLAPTHLFWIGPSGVAVSSAVRTFLKDTL